MNLGRWEIDDFVTFTCNTHDPETGEATDADSVPTYRVYEDETGTPILTGSMALLDSANTAGFYSERIQLTAASGFEVGKTYSIYISATVNSIEGTISRTLQVVAAATAPSVAQIADGVWDELIAGHVAAGSFGAKNQKVVPSETIADYKADVSALSSQASVDVIDGIVDAILVDTGTTLPAEHALLATAAAIAALNDLSSADVAAELATYDGPTRAEATSDKDEIIAEVNANEAKIDIIDTNVDAILVDTGTTIPADLATIEGKIDTVDTVVDAIKAVTDLLPDGGALTTIDSNIDAILVDTGTTLPAAIAALNDLSSAEVQTVLENNDLDHLLKVAHPTGDPVASTIFDLVMNKDVSQTFDRADDSLEAISDGESTAPSAADVADAVWEEAIGDHTTSTTFGGKNQKVVPSETINDYKADVSALASQASVDTIDGIVDLILVDTGTTLPAEHATLATAAALATVDANVDAILVDTDTTIPGLIAALNDLAAADIQTVLETNDLDHLAKVAHPSGDPVADTLFDLIMNKDGSQTFDRSTDALEVIAAASGATPAQIADAVWDELAGDHTGSTTFGGKNQNNVPSETLNDYKADVSGLATSAALATHDAKLDTVDTVVDAIKAVTDLLPDAGALNDLALILADTNELQGDWTDGGRLDLILDAVKVDTAAILVDTGTTIPATLAGLATAAALATVDSNVDAILVDTGTSIPATLSGIESDIADLTSDLNDHDTDIKADLVDLSDDVADVKADTETIIATIGAIPVGAITFTYNVTNTVSGQPIADTDVWVTTDIGGTNVIASGKTDQFGNVTFYLDAGTVYMWRQKSGFNFDNPDTEVVS
jgi:hypothetical protein